jgi:hypothetical protein
MKGIGINTMLYNELDERRPLELGVQIEAPLLDSNRESMRTGLISKRNPPGVAVSGKWTC